ncbi:MAG: DUF692 domain-containing protein, partial [Candidatus Eremiobacterota bacterium]
LGFVEVMAEDFSPEALPPAVRRLSERGLKVVPHGVSLSLGGADPPAPERLAHLGRLARAVQAPLVSEHLAFVRAGHRESGHLLPLERSRESLDVVVENVRRAADSLPVPLAVENIATLVEWPLPEMDEADFLSEVVNRAGCGLLLDITNVYANSRNHGYDPLDFLDRIPLDRVAYVHVAGGMERNGLYLDTHAHPIQPGSLELLEELFARSEPPGVLLERDDNFPGQEDFQAELDALRAAMDRGRARR